MIHFEFDAGAPLVDDLPMDASHAVGVVPLRLRICGLDLFTSGFYQERTAEPGWAPIGLIGLVTYGRHSFRLVRMLGTSAWPVDESGESLLFKMEAEDVLVHSTLTHVTVKVPYVKLDAAWATFAARVRHLYATTFPHLEDDPIWSLPDKPLSDFPHVNWRTLWQAEFEGHDGCFDRIDRECR